jgi:hypothetical protein
VEERLDLAVAAVLPDIVAASMVKAMLEQADIPVMLRGSGSTDWLIPGTPGGAGPLEVIVPRERLMEACELIGELEAEGGATDAESGVTETEGGEPADDVAVS